MTMSITAQTSQRALTTRNVIAELPGRDNDNVILVGAHLDSVNAGPGINDNGSGSAAILETAIQMAKVKPRNTVRFAWWSAEESNLIGSTRYVDSLSQAELDRIALNLNFDMVGSPNFVRFVYDGDNSAFPVGPGAALGPPGSGAIEALFHEYFASQGLASAETPFSGRSDYGPFIAKGIPAGGLFTGAEGIKTAAQAATYGGTADIAYDPCYHAACDTYANPNPTVLGPDRGRDRARDDHVCAEHRGRQRRQGEGQLQAAADWSGQPRRDVRRSQRRPARQPLGSRVLAGTSEGLRPEPLTSHA